MKLLFVCTGNTCRSPMAEGLAKTILPGDYIVSSAGLNACSVHDVNPKAVAVLSNKGIDISKHKARRVSRQLLEEYDLIVTMTRAQKQSLAYTFPELAERIMQLAELANAEAEILDPWGGSLEVYEQCAQELEFLIKEAAKKLI